MSWALRLCAERWTFSNARAISCQGSTQVHAVTFGQEGDAGMIACALYQAAPAQSSISVCSSAPWIW